MIHLVGLMITLNENADGLLVQSLSQLRRICDEVIVVDGGSTDGTLDIVGKYATRWVIVPWTGDHAAQRNAGLSLVENGWCLQLDPDELFCDQVQTDIRGFLSSLPEDVVSASIYAWNYVRDISHTIDQRDWVSHHHIRMFRSHIRFSGIIHEQPEVHGIHWVPHYVGRLHHYGWCRDTRYLQFKIARRNYHQGSCETLENLFARACPMPPDHRDNPSFKPKSLVFNESWSPDQFYDLKTYLPLADERSGIMARKTRPAKRKAAPHTESSYITLVLKGRNIVDIELNDQPVKALMAIRKAFWHNNSTTLLEPTLSQLVIGGRTILTRDIDAASICQPCTRTQPYTLLAFADVDLRVDPERIPVDEDALGPGGELYYDRFDDHGHTIVRKCSLVRQ